MSQQSDASAWRAWGQQARPELLEAFNAQVMSTMDDCRRQFPAQVVPGTEEYARLRAKCSAELLRNAELLDPEYFHEED